MSKNNFIEKNPFSTKDCLSNLPPIYENNMNASNLKKALFVTSAIATVALMSPVAWLLRSVEVPVFSKSQFISADEREIDSPVILESHHLAVLPPHVHGAGDSLADEWHHYILTAPVTVAPRDIYATGFDYQFFNAPSSTVHHMSLFDSTVPNPNCPKLPTGNELFSYSADRMYDNSVRLPPGFALFIKKGTPLRMYVMLHNPQPPIGPGGTYHDVYTRVELKETTDAPDSLRLVHPYLLHLDQVPCAFTGEDGSGSFMFSVPPKSNGFRFNGNGKTDRAASKTFDHPATIINLTGHVHVHQGGQELTVYKNDDELFVFRPSIAAASPYLYYIYPAPATYHVIAGDTVWLSAMYDNPASVATEGAMGMAGFYYVEDK